MTKEPQQATKVQQPGQRNSRSSKKKQQQQVRDEGSTATALNTTKRIHPSPHDIMRSFSKAIAFLLAFDATTSIDFTTRRETGKFSKKNEALRVCTYHNFVGSSKYVNCRDIETEIKIECGDEDADDTTRMCKVTEHPWNNEQKEDDTDASTAACVVHGLFDPNTHITTDSATGLCHLKFLSLLNSCDVDANGSPPSGVFGMKAEIRNRRNTDNDDNSGMMLRFSHTGGAVYYPLKPEASRTQG